jgi:tetratricopeptide (TPR) repeat protein
MPLRATLDAPVALHGDDPWIARNAAQIAGACGDTLGEIKAYEAIVTRFPNFSAAWVSLAKARAKNEDHGGAAEAWRSASAIWPERLNWRTNLAAELFATGRLDEAREEYARLSLLNPNDPDIWWGLGQAREKDQQFAGAIEAYREGLRHVPEHAGLHYYLAKALVHEDQSDEAREIASAGLTLDPENKGLQQLAKELQANP